VGATLLAFVTSVPELVTTISAARIGADDMAVGNLFGSNMFNMFLLGAADLLLPRSALFSVIDDSFLLVGSLGLILTILGLVGNLARIEKRLLFIEIDALLLILVYFGGMALLYSRGLTP
jgi:cation:H+ antiporter